MQKFYIFLTNENENPLWLPLFLPSSFSLLEAALYHEYVAAKAEWYINSNYWSKVPKTSAFCSLCKEKKIPINKLLMLLVVVIWKLLCISFKFKSSDLSQKFKIVNIVLSV